MSTVTVFRPEDFEPRGAVLKRYAEVELRRDWYGTVTLGTDKGGGEMRVLHGMIVEAKVGEVLSALRENRIEHASIVEEAMAGYQKKVEERLQKAIADVREGKVDPTLGYGFNLSGVKNHTRVYDRAIRMFELEQRTIVELTQEQVGCLIMDEWDWKDDFIGSNAIYSAKAMRLSEDR